MLTEYHYGCKYHDIKHKNRWEGDEVRCHLDIMLTEYHCGCKYRDINKKEVKMRWNEILSWYMLTEYHYGYMYWDTKHKKEAWDPDMLTEYHCKMRFHPDMNTGKYYSSLLVSRNWTQKSIEKVMKCDFILICPLITTAVVSIQTSNTKKKWKRDEARFDLDMLTEYYYSCMHQDTEHKRKVKRQKNKISSWYSRQVPHNTISIEEHKKVLKRWLKFHPDVVAEYHYHYRYRVAAWRRKQAVMRKRWNEISTWHSQSTTAIIQYQNTEHKHNEKGDEVSFHID